jgi:hypothetical protein
MYTVYEVLAKKTRLYIQNMSCPRRLLVLSLALLSTADRTEGLIGWSLQSPNVGGAARTITSHSTRTAVFISFSTRKQSSKLRSQSFYDDDEDKDERELVSVPKRGRRRQEYTNDEDYDDPDYDYKSDRDRSYFDQDEYDEDEDDYDEEEDFHEEDMDTQLSDLFENVVIPNPLLDSIDPDGAFDRFPELAADPRFWFDLALFIAVINFLSWSAPRDPFNFSSY